jgi:hypothetical protein
MHISYKFVLVREPCGILNVTGFRQSGDYSEQELKLGTTQKVLTWTERHCRGRVSDKFLNSTYSGVLHPNSRQQATFVVKFDVRAILAVGVMCQQLNVGVVLSSHVLPVVLGFNKSETKVRSCW